MSFIVRVYCNDRIYSIDLSSCGKKVTIGSDPADTLQLACSGLKSGHITIKGSRDNYVIKGKNMYDRAGSCVSSAELSAGKIFVVETEPEINIAIHPRQKDGNHIISLEGIHELLIGREHTNNIVFNNRRTSSVHCKIYNDFGVLKIRDMGSSNGTYVNGKKTYEKNLVEGDIISISIYDILLRNNTLTIFNGGEDITVNSESSPETVGTEKEEITRVMEAYATDESVPASEVTGASAGEEIVYSGSKGTVSLFDD